MVSERRVETLDAFSRDVCFGNLQIKNEKNFGRVNVYDRKSFGKINLIRNGEEPGIWFFLGSS